MTVVGPNRVYPDVDNLYLSLCEVAVYGGCPPLPPQAMQGTMSAIAAVASESLGANCEITMGTETLAFLDAERACNRQGGHTRCGTEEVLISGICNCAASQLPATADKCTIGNG